MTSADENGWASQAHLLTDLVSSLFDRIGRGLLAGGSRVRRILVVGIVPIVALVVWSFMASSSGTVTTPAPMAASSKEQPPLASVARQTPAYRTEQEWLIQEAVGTIAYEAWAARGGAPTGVNLAVRTRPATAEALLDRAVVDVTVGDTSATLDVSTHMWDPAVFVPIARTLLGHAPANLTSPSSDGQPLVADLTNPRVETLLAADDRVSTALARNRFDRAAHEDAALLVGALAWRERAEKYSDVRLLLSRMTAHLAVAAAVQPDRPAGESGRLASLIVSVLAGREDLFTSDLAAWPEATRTPAVEAWIRTMRLRVIGDWRAVRVTRASSLLERLEYARTLRDRAGSSNALAFLDEQIGGESMLGDRGLEERTDWQRTVLAAPGGQFALEAGHRFADDAAEFELAEATTVWRHYHEGNPSHTALIAALNDDAREEGRVLGWTVWAPALQRHVAAALAASARLLYFYYSVPDMSAWPSTVEPRFGALRLFPFVLRDAASNASQYHHAMQLAQRAQLARPELVTAGVSRMLRTKPRFDAPDELGPDDTAWLTPHEPTGTGFDLMYRTLAAGCPRPVPIVHVERWAARAPHSTYVQNETVWLRAPGEPTFADVQRGLAHLLEYDLGAAYYLTNLHSTPEQLIPLARTMCHIDKDACGQLIEALIKDGRDEEAVAAADAYARSARDTVGVSHHLGWVVKYLWDTNRQKQAMQLAALADETGSGSGMATMGYVLERLEQWDKADAMYSTLNARYEEPTDLTAFCLRRAAATHDDQWIARAKQVGVKIFPKGIERVDPAWLPAPPQDGAFITSCGRRCTRYGLRPGDIITAVDGFRVRTAWQYMVLSRASYDPHMRFAVWRDRKTVVLDLTVPQRWFALDLVTHPSIHEQSTN